MKSFSTVRGTPRDVHSYMEKRRGRREIEVAKRRRGGIKRRETDPASDQFPKCSSQPRTHKDWVELGREENREGEDRGDLGEKRESQKGERAIRPVILLPSKSGY